MAIGYTIGIGFRPFFSAKYTYDDSISESGVKWLGLLFWKFRMDCTSGQFCEKVN